MAACISLGGKLFEPKNSNIFTSINNLAIQFGFVSTVGMEGYYIGAFLSGSTFVYQSDNSPIANFAPNCNFGPATCPTGAICCVLIDENRACWFTFALGPPCTVTRNYVCEYEYEGKYLHYSLQLEKFILSFKNDSVF